MSDALDVRPTLSIIGGRVLDVVAGELVEGTVHIADGLVVALGSSAADFPTAEHTVDAHGRVILPGLIDAHFHAFAVGLDPTQIHTLPLSYVTLRAARRLERALRRGFTTVRDVAGGESGLALALAERIIEGPRYLHTGPALSQTGGHGDTRGALVPAGSCSGHLSEVVDGPDDMRRVARDRFRQGVHAIKIMTSGGVVSPVDPIRVPQYSAEEVRAVTEEAMRRGSYVAAHAYSPEAIVHSITNGVRSIEHGNLLDAPTAALMAAHEAFLVPTLVAYDAMGRRGRAMGMTSVALDKNRQVLDSGQHAVELAVAAGVSIGFGSDLMGDLEDDQLLGLRLQSEVVGVLDAIRAATLGNAKLIGRDDLGRVGTGLPADLLVLTGDPLTDPEVLWDDREGARVVVRAGEPLIGAARIRA